MSKINARDAWVNYTPPTVANQEDPTCGQVVVDTADRAKLYTGADLGKRFATARKLIPDDAEVPELEVYRAMLRLLTLDGFAFAAVWTAFHAVDGLAEALPDGAWRDLQTLAVG